MANKAEVVSNLMLIMTPLILCIVTVRLTLRKKYSNFGNSLTLENEQKIVYFNVFIRNVFKRAEYMELPDTIYTNDDGQ